MHLALIGTLKFQIPAALFLLLTLFTGSASYTLYAIQQRRNDDVLLNLAGKLQLTAQRLAMQGLNYVENAPRDYPTYYRDVRLYYRDLMAHVATFDQITQAFSQANLPPELTQMEEPIRPRLDVRATMSVEALHSAWADYHRQLMEALGEDPDEPRLEYAAQHVVDNQQLLETLASQLLGELERFVGKHLEQIGAINRTVLLLALAVALAIVGWFFVRVLRPLGAAVDGFRKVAQGDFRQQLTVSGNNEIAWLTDAFNRLSMRLNSLFRLIDRIQGGSDLDNTLRFVCEEFSTFLPIDWVGSLLRSSEGSTIRLERAYADGQADIAERTVYPLAGTLLAEAMDSGEPLHIPGLPDTAQQNPQYRFLRLLARKGMHSAIFLPITEPNTASGVLVFASRTPGAYTPEHLELLTNIAHLITHSFGKTVKLVERSHLAAIGEFASGIAHEIRNPLATINLALDYLERREALAEPARRRVELAAGEAARMERLLRDILLYAKPVALDLQNVDLCATLERFLESNRGIADTRNQTFHLRRTATQVSIMGDRDRLTQIFLNLANNACEAAPRDSVIDWEVSYQEPAPTVSVRVHNGGDPIPAEVLPRLLQPFFTTKSQGTGLGLGIVKRLVDAHGGDITIDSKEKSGTTVSVTLPVSSAAPDGV